jgi:ADP-ribose pyrophosphatase
MDFTERTIKTESIYKGNIISLEKITVQLPNDKIATRDVVRHPGAAAVIPITDDGCVVMVKQFRKPLEKVCLEIPAGKLDKGEQPLECAKRELEEETGYKAKDIKFVLSIDTAAGFSDETIHLFLATGLEAGELKPDEDEFVEVEKIKIDDLINMIFQGKINDAKTIIGAFIAQKQGLNN